MDVRQQAISGVVPPEQAEARVRERYPSVAAFPAIASIGQRLNNTLILAPLGWLLMAAPFFLKVAPFFMRRYTLTNRRLMLRKGWKGVPVQEVPLADIDEVRLTRDDNTDFFRAATLEVVKNGSVALTLPGVPDPEAFRQTILQTRNAWAPGKVKQLPFIAASATK